MVDPQNTNEDIIELTEIIEKGDSSASADFGTVNKAVPEARENATGTALESLNDAPATSPEGDIDFLLAQMDADDKNETTAQPEAVTADETGHIVDPHEKLDMSGMEEVDNLLSALQIPLTPVQAGGGEDDPTRENADASRNAAPAPQGDTPFDLDTLLKPRADVNAPEDAEAQDEQESGDEPPAPPPGADAQAPEKAPTKVRELSAELDDILAAAGEPGLPEESSPQQPPDKEETLSGAVEELPSSRPPAEALTGDSPARTQEAQPAAETLPGEMREPPSLPADHLPELEKNLTETTRESSAHLAERLLETENRLDALEKGLAEVVARESLPRMAARLLEAENRLDALEKSLTEVTTASDLKAFVQRLTDLESATITPKDENPAPVEENSRALHAYMELAARLDGTEERLNAAAKLVTRMDGIETRLNAVAELTTRVNDMETRLSAVTEQFETRMEKAAAAAAARLLREEIAGLLAS
ncbi:MAG: hypothetical protein LBN96_06945 [Desulfovibrio sp.]|jgi:hypothetical protein|nr:hypothetical protein [Desulfovibrio sp.]